jgi:hypothetical protein
VRCHRTPRSSYNSAVTRLLLLGLFACSAKPQPPSGASGSAVLPVVTPADASATYAGPPERGPCSDAHGCKLRSVCGCSCEAVVLSVPSQMDCDKSCPGDPCKGMSLICDLSTQTCGALPKAP